MTDKSERIVFRCSESTKKAVESLAHEWEVSSSELMRQQARSMIQDGATALPEHVRIRFRRQQIKDQSAPDKYRAYFRNNMTTQAIQAWETGASADEGTVLLRSFLEEQEMLFDEFDNEGTGTFIDGEQIKQWATGLIALYRYARRNSGYGKEHISRYQSQYPDHMALLRECLENKRSDPCLEANLVYGWVPADDPMLTGRYATATAPDRAIPTISEGGEGQ